MFDFIKRLFNGRSEQCAKVPSPGTLDIVECNNIEIIKTSDYSEGTPNQAADSLILAESSPTDDLDEKSELPTPSDNYLSGQLGGDHLLHDMQTRKAGLAYWDSGLAKYRPRDRRPVMDGANAKDFRYFESIKLDPSLRQLELQNPGLCLELLNFNTFVNNSLKGKLIGQFVARSMQVIREQQELVDLEKLTQSQTHADHGPAASRGAADKNNAMNEKALKSAFKSIESATQIQETVGPENPTDNQFHLEDHIFMHIQDLANTWTKPELEHHFEQVEELFQPSLEEQNQESYTRWLLSVAETANESGDVLWLLVGDSNPDVRFCMAENYNLNQSILIALSNDENPYVAHRAHQTLTRLKDTGRVVDHQFGNAVFKNRKSG
jgi:hypothetical protein